jgi:cytochrome c oxidase subunit II
MLPQRSHRRRAVGLICLAALFASLLAACTQSPATVEGGRVQVLYNLFLIAAGGVFVVVAGLIGWNIARYRAAGRDELPVQTHTNLTLELFWWALPTALVIGLFVASAVVLNTNDARSANPQVRVRVEGFQWGWRFTFPDSGVQVAATPNAPPELLLPVGEIIDFQLVSDDVIHAFFIPRFLVKRDTVPGVDNHLQLTIDQEGTYAGQCAEFCGLLHDQMLFSIRAVTPAEFQSWLAAQPGSGDGS